MLKLKPTIQHLHHPISYTPPKVIGDSDKPVAEGHKSKEEIWPALMLLGSGSLETFAAEQ